MSSSREWGVSGEGGELARAIIEAAVGLELGVGIVEGARAAGGGDGGGHARDRGGVSGGVVTP